MKLPVLRTLKYLTPASVFVIILVVGTLSLQQTSASSDPPPSNPPGFDGELSTNILDEIKEPSTKNIIVAEPQEEWETVFEEDFEDEDWDDEQWMNLHQGGDGYRYGTRDIENPFDSNSMAVAWSVGTSPEGEPPLNPEVDGYPDEVSAWLIAGPFVFTDVAKINLSLDYFFEADVGDTFEIHAASEFGNFSGPKLNGGAGVWKPFEWDFSDFAGEPSVWFAFIFRSDDLSNTDDNLGLLIDNVKVEVRGASDTHLPFLAHDLTPIPEATATPDVTPTPTITPGDDYIKGFQNRIEPWEKVRWSDGANSELKHNDSCEGSICGFLNLEVEKSNHYTIVSPKEPSKPYPYTLETRAKIRSPRQDGDAYGVIFGASTNGQKCPENDFSSCFNHYYELRVQYRDSSGDQWLEFKLVKVEGHDNDNQPLGRDLIGWTRIDDGPNYFVEWDIEVKKDGNIIIEVFEDKVGEANDSDFLNNPYFGLVVTSGQNGSSNVKFDFVGIK